MLNGIDRTKTMQISSGFKRNSGRYAITLIADIELSIQLLVEYKQEIKLRVYEECNQTNGPIMQYKCFRT